jgi:hypothetical protein
LIKHEVVASEVSVILTDSNVPIELGAPFKSDPPVYIASAYLDESIADVTFTSTEGFKCFRGSSGLVTIEHADNGWCSLCGGGNPGSLPDLRAIAIEKLVGLGLTEAEAIAVASS